MPEHDIEITLPPKLLKNVDATIVAWSDGVRLGELRFSKGTVDWRRVSKKKWKYITWEKFAKALDEA